MTDNPKISLTVTAIVQVPVEKAWQLWTTPAHIMQWNNASDDWHTPKAENDLRESGSFSYTMAAKDGSFGFDFWGAYDIVNEHDLIEYTLGDGRKVQVHFGTDGNGTAITEVFEAETMNSPELQQQGWQAILNNFKKYAETNL
ncbi:MAG: SRPBCC family protein [Chitinophagaceae bacterium]|nr:SRPBCC family protein [Chitinophagaceae bacterium]MBK8952352.1 SRPBCC family protein [Chitinophagaceae bacterium]